MRCNYLVFQAFGLMAGGTPTPLVQPDVSASAVQILATSGFLETCYHAPPDSRLLTSDSLGMKRSAGQFVSKTTGTVTELEPGTARPVGEGVSRKELSGRLAGLTLWQQVLVLAFWPLLEQLMSFLVGTVDMALAGRLEPETAAQSAADALGVAAYFGWLMSLFHSSVAVGATALVARAIGARHKRLANAVLGQSMLLSVFSGLFVAVSVYFAAPWMTPPGMTQMAERWGVLYLRMVALVAPASAVLLVGTACLRGAGDTRTPFMVMVVVNLVNIGASLLFVHGPAPIGGHGVAGIAAGTQLAWIVGAGMTLWMLGRGRVLRLRKHRLRPHAHTIRRILRVGVPNLLEGVGAMWLGNYFILVIVSTLGVPGAVGAHMIAIRAESLSFLPGFAMGIAAATLMGQYLGLGDPDRARRAVMLCWWLAAAFMGVLGVTFMLFPGGYIFLMTDAPGLTELATTPLIIAGTVQVFFAAQMVFGQALRGAGDTKATMAITAFSTLVVRVPSAYVIAHTLGYGLTGVWVALCGEMVVRAGLFTARFFHGGWRGIEG